MTTQTIPAASGAAAVQKLQGNRLRMTGLSVVNFALQSGILALYAATGSVAWSTVLWFFAVSVGHSLGFWWLIRSNRNLRLKDPGMLTAQIGASWAVQLGFMVVAPQLSIIFMVCLLVGYNSAMIAFDGRQFTIAWLLQGSATAAALYLGHGRFGYPGGSDADIAILWLFFFLCTFRLTAIGTQYSTLRAKLSQRNQQLLESLERIEELASHDDLTGLFNRRAFMTHLAAEVARAQRTGMPFCVAVLDIDHFKSVNDRHGHPVGDEVLKAFCRIGAAQLRVSDVFARYGGEEFVVLLVMPTERSAALCAVERIREAVAGHDWSGLTPGQGITVSAGVASFRPDDTAERLVSRADEALYQAKSSGRNRVALAQD